MVRLHFSLYLCVILLFPHVGKKFQEMTWNFHRIFAFVQSCMGRTFRVGFAFQYFESIGNK